MTDVNTAREIAEAINNKLRQVGRVCCSDEIWAAIIEPLLPEPVQVAEGDRELAKAIADLDEVWGKDKEMLEALIAAYRESILVDKWEECSTCWGSGVVGGDDEVESQCPDCEGRGFVPVKRGGKE